MVVVHFVGGLPGFLFAGLRDSLKDCLAGVSGFKGGWGAGRETVLLIFQPSHFIVYLL